jgi:FtsP/CotA-like multicopper oxidase with cupredoxin domain
MKRRDFIKAGASSVAAIMLGSLSDIPPIFRNSICHAAQVLEFEIVEVLKEMVDQTRVFHWAFSSVAPPLGPSIPGPVINALEGEVIRLTVINRLDEDHSFQIPGVVDTGPIPPNGRVTVQVQCTDRWHLHL